jgi:3-mercaptopyruvate sulfurtransferase SseA
VKGVKALKSGIQGWIDAGYPLAKGPAAAERVPHP